MNLNLKLLLQCKISFHNNTLIIIIKEYLFIEGYRNIFRILPGNVVALSVLKYTNTWN